MKHPVNKYINLHNDKEQLILTARFDVSETLMMKIKGFWDMTVGLLLNSYRHFEGYFFLRRHSCPKRLSRMSLNFETESSYEMSLM
jgi:hypothetical protein